MERVEKNEGLPEPAGRIAKRPGLGEGDSSKFSALHEKIPLNVTIPLKIRMKK